MLALFNFVDKMRVHGKYSLRRGEGKTARANVRVRKALLGQANRLLFANNSWGVVYLFATLLRFCALWLVLASASDHDRLDEFDSVSYRLRS